MRDLRLQTCCPWLAALALVGCSSKEVPFVDAYPSRNWPAIHRGPKNTDFLAPPQQQGPLEATFTEALGTVAAVLSVGPNGSLYVTTAGTDPEGCHLYALDPDTGEERWCSTEVGPEVLSSSALSDVDGTVYLADDQAMHAFSDAGAHLWSSPIAAAPQSAHFLGDGSLFFVSRNGVAYVLDRETGASRLEPVELVPGLAPGAQAGCLIGGAESGCPAANTPAVDLDTGAIYLTLTRPGETTGAMVALSYDPNEPSLSTAWEAQVLLGGGGASPAISADGTRIYVTDGTGRLLALDAAEGAVIWELPVGEAPLGSPAVTPDGRIFPGPLGPLLAVDDAGDAGVVAWENPDAGAFGVVAVSGERAFAAGEGALSVFDVADGAVLQTLQGPGLSIGTSVDSDGRVFTASFSQVFGYRLAQ